VLRFFQTRKRRPSRRRAQPVSRFVKLYFEELENRTLLSHAGLSAGPLLHAVHQDYQANFATYTPSQILDAYGFNNSVSVNVGGTATQVDLTGAGQTIAIVNAFDAPNIIADLQAFDSAFGTSSLDNFGSYEVQGQAVGGPSGNGPKFSKVAVSSSGDSASDLPAADAGWSLETSLDVEWAHAVAPGANIMLVEAASDSNSDLLAAVGFAKQQPGVSVVSMSWGEGEFAGETNLDSTFSAPGVTFVAASGDSGGTSGVSWPAASPNVLSVGGTQLNITDSGTTETAWSGSTGGVSAFESKPSYQNTGSIQTDSRANPDVAYNASPSTSYAVFDSYGQPGMVSVYGTSAGAPQWSGLVARANEGLSLQGQTSLANAQAAVYTLNAASFNDITSGSNATATATTGFDLVTGLGSPKADQVISGLIAAASSDPATTTAPSHPSTTSPSTRTTPSKVGALAGTGTTPFQSFLTLGQAPTTTAAAAQVVVNANPGSSASATSLLSTPGTSTRLTLEPTGPHLQADAAEGWGGGGGADIMPAADTGPAAAPDNIDIND
jgi:subtilase family serine protease